MKTEYLILLAIGAYALWQWNQSKQGMPVQQLPPQSGTIPASVAVTSPDTGIIWVHPDITQIPFAASFQTNDPTFFDFSV